MAVFRISEHAFTPLIINILKKHFGDYASDILVHSAVLAYLNHKTKSADRGSKARGSFANHYALYVVIEDYINKGFFDGSADTPYSKYEGARFTELFRRQRQLPFGSKLQNHALNSRLNNEFERLYPEAGKCPIVRDIRTQRYWIQEDLLNVVIPHKNGKNHIYNC